MSVKSHFDLIVRPLITEKATICAESGKYIFEVSSSANKVNVKKAIEKIFEVKVSKVNIINQVGKLKRFKGVIGKRSGYKKAVVTLESGSAIDVVGGVK